MKANKLSKLAVVCVIASLGVQVAQAAIDDMGMQYVSAAEGFSGSFRANLYERTDLDGANDDATKLGGADSLRLYLNGSADLGSGMQTTYALELRNTGNLLTIHNWNVGLTRSGFGTLVVGKTTQAAFMVPGGSLDTIAGSSAESLSVDPDINVLTFKSSRFGNMQLGTSARALGNETGDTSEGDILDQYDVAATYSWPVGVVVGGAFEIRLAHAERFSTAEASANGDKFGYRIGARYDQGNFVVAYEFRTYDNALFFGESGSITGNVVAATGGTNLISQGSIYNNSIDYSDKVSYNVHRAATKISVEKFTGSVNFSTETQEIKLVGAKDAKRTTLGADLAYSLGAKSQVAVGLQKKKTDSWTVNSGDLVVGTVAEAEETTTKVWYKVDF